jgi:hypothetical protein
MEEEMEDTEMKIKQLQDKVKQHADEHHMKWLYTKDSPGTNNTQGNKRKRADDRGAGGGAEGASTAHCAELGEQGYEVEPQDIVDESGFVIESFSRVRQALSAYATR